MLISNSNKFVFIHIPKTGGSSVGKALVPYARWQERMCLEFWPSRKAIALINRTMGWTAAGYKQYTGIHKHARASLIRAAMPPGLFDQYFRFTVVRNPFDRIVSVFLYGQPPSSHLSQGSFAFYTESLIDRFRTFVRRTARSAVSPMLHFVQDPDTGELLVDDVARLESIEADFERIQRRIGLPVIRAIPRTNVSRVRPSIPLQEWYDEPTHELVVKRYGPDFELFGYSTLLPAPASRRT